MLRSLRAWWSDAGLRQGWVGLFSIFALAPFILLQLTAGDHGVHRITWGFARYFALPWLVVLYGIIRPPEVNWWTLARVVLVTANRRHGHRNLLEKHLAPDDSNPPAIDPRRGPWPTPCSLARTQTGLVLTSRRVARSGLRADRWATRWGLSLQPLGGTHA